MFSWYLILFLAEYHIILLSLETVPSLRPKVGRRFFTTLDRFRVGRFGSVIYCVSFVSMPSRCQAASIKSVYANLLDVTPKRTQSLRSTHRCLCQQPALHGWSIHQDKSYDSLVVHSDGGELAENMCYVSPSPS